MVRRKDLAKERVMVLIILSFFASLQLCGFALKVFENYGLLSKYLIQIFSQRWCLLF